MTRGVLILGEHLKGELSDVTFEMLGVGRRTADALQVPLHAVLVGRGVASLAPAMGAADRVFVADTPGMEVPPARTAALLLGRLMERHGDDLVLVAGTNLAMGVGSLLSQRVGLPFANFGRAIEVDGGAVVVTSQLFGGKILSDVRLPDARGIVSAYPGSFPAEAGRSDRTPEVEVVETPAEAPEAAFIRYIEPEAGDTDITKQDILVAVGRGIQTEDNISLAEELAGALGGAVCGSRPVVDQGWLPLTRQVGKSGMSVKPRLYLALGISGAPEHIEGMRGSRLTVAVNTDANAPIFDFAQYGYCGDVLELLPALTERVRARKG
jgi:electron transfer flavoprotein alpha subunit